MFLPISSQSIISQFALIIFNQMETPIRVQVKELKVGSKFKMGQNELDILVITELDNQVAYCTHFLGIYVLPVERFVYKVA